MDIGGIIKKLRVNAGLKQGKLAEDCGISQAYLSQIEKGDRYPHIPTLKKISEVLEIPLPVLLFLSVDESDIPEKKRDAFRVLFPPIRALLVELFPKEVEAAEN